MEQQNLTPDMTPDLNTIPGIPKPGTVMRYDSESFLIINSRKLPSYYHEHRYELTGITESGKYHVLTQNDSQHFQPTDNSTPSPHTWRKLLTNKAVFPVGNFTFTTTIGSDPEIFAVSGDGSLIPAWKYLGKKQPYLGPQTFYDGFQAEWTTPAHSCLGLLTDSIHKGMKEVYLAAKAFDPTATLSIRPVMDITSDLLQDATKEYLALGCARSYNAYGEPPLVVDAPELLPFRSAGWHMHFCPGYNPIGESIDTAAIFPLVESQVVPSIKLLDAVLGVAMITFGQGYHDSRRRELYGRAGEYRCNKTVEYRVPEPILGASPATFNLLWDLGRLVWTMGMRGLGFLWDAEEDEVRTAINQYDVPLARKILERNEPLLKKMLFTCYLRDFNSIDHGLATIYEGIGYAVAEPDNIVKNWKLDEQEWHLEGYHPAGVMWSKTASELLAHGNKA